MKSFKNFISEKKEQGAFPVSDPDMKKLQRQARPETSLSSAEKIRKGLEPAQERQARIKRTVPSSRSISTPTGTIFTNMPLGGTKTPEEQMMRAERGRNNPRGKTASSGDVTDYLGKQRDSGAKTSFDMEASGERPTVRKTAGTEPRKRLKPDSYVVDDTPQTPASKPEVVKQSEVSKKAAEYRKAFGKPTGVDAQGYATYVPPKDVPKGETGRRAQRTSNPRTYSSVKAEIEGAKGFRGVKSGGLEMRNAPAPVKRYRETRATRIGIPEPFTSPGSFSQTEYEKGLRKIVKKQVKATGTRPTPTEANPFKDATYISKTKPKSQGAPDRTATKQAVRDLRASQQRLNISTEAGGKVSTQTTTSVPTKNDALALRQDSPMHRGAYDAAFGNTKKPDVSKPPKTKSYKQFTSQPGSVKTRKGAWSYTPSAEKAKKVADALPKTQSTPQISAKKFGMLRNVVKAKSALGGLGRIAGPAITAFDAYGAYKAERERGQTKERATKAAIYKAGGGALGGWAGAKAGAATGAAIGSLAGPVGTAAGGIIGGLAGGIAGYVGGEKIGSAALGASQKDKDWMKWANRKNQAGVTADAAKFKSGNKAVITDKSGKERVGYKAYKDGKEVYKHANDPKSLQYTSSNPLERIGRTFFPGAYKDSDAATRRKNVQSIKTTGSK